MSTGKLALGVAAYCGEPPGQQRELFLGLLDLGMTLSTLIRISLTELTATRCGDNY